MLHLRIRTETEDEVEALRQAVLRARASELAELRRLELRLSAGYGDGPTRASMSEEAARARLRWTMLDRLSAELSVVTAPDDVL